MADEETVSAPIPEVETPPSDAVEPVPSAEGETPTPPPPETETPDTPPDEAAEEQTPDPLAEFKDQLTPERRKYLLENDDEFKEEIKRKAQGQKDTELAKFYSEENEAKRTAAIQQAAAENQRQIAWLTSLEPAQRAAELESNRNLSLLWGQAGQEQQQAPVRQARFEGAVNVGTALLKQAVFAGATQEEQAAVGMAWNAHLKEPTEANATALSKAVTFVYDGHLERNYVHKDKVKAQIDAEVKALGDAATAEVGTPQFEASSNGSAGNGDLSLSQYAALDYEQREKMRREDPGRIDRMTAAAARGR